MKAVVVLGGPPPADGARAELDGARVFAADAGANLVARWGVRPAAVLGDMDSVDPEVLRRFEADGVRVVRHPRAKLHTDARLALDAALAAGATEVVLLGATGGRIDQTVANLQLVRRAAEAGAAVRVVDAGCRGWAVTPARPLAAPFPKGQLLSVLPLTERATGVRETGVEWPLEDAVMEFTDPYGVSNVAAGGPVEVACASGVLLVLALP